MLNLNRQVYFGVKTITNIPPEKVEEAVRTEAVNPGHPHLVTTHVDVDGNKSIELRVADDHLPGATPQRVDYQTLIADA